jgi:hypothetical protein
MMLGPKLKVPVWVCIWLLTRAVMVVQVGVWRSTGPEYQDVYTYEGWSNFIATTGSLPTDETWQYPPAAAFLMLIPRVGIEWEGFAASFVVLMLIFDLIGFWLMTRLAKEERQDTAVWIWLLAMPVLYNLPLLRFDLVPTVIAMAALLALHRRPIWMGALVGVGAMIKVWPAFVLFGEWDRDRLLRSAAAALAAVVAIFVLAWVAFGDPFGFVTNQKDRGLQVEAVAASPWQLRQVITGTQAPIVPRFGTLEVGSGLADAVAKGLDLIALLLLVAAAWWWWLRNRAIKRGMSYLAERAVARDFVFTVVLLFVVVSRVLSPQYMIWLVGLCAVVLGTRGTRVARPAWVVIGAAVLTAGLYQSPANFLIRNLALVVAALDASIILLSLVIGRSAPESTDPAAEPAALTPSR